MMMIKSKIDDEEERLRKAELAIMERSHIALEKVQSYLEKKNKLDIILQQAQIVVSGNIQHNDNNNNNNNSPQRSRNDTVSLREALVSLNVFRMLKIPPEAEMQLSAKVNVLRFPRKDSHVFMVGQVGDCAYVVLQGRVRIYIMDSSGAERTMAKRESGEIFGEVAITSENCTRTASVSTDLAETVLLKINREDYLLAVASAKEKEANHLAQVLGGISFFRFVPFEKRRQLVQKYSKRHYKANEVITKQGDPANEAYIVLKGCCKVIRKVRIPSSSLIKSQPMENRCVGSTDIVGIQRVSTSAGSMPMLTASKPPSTGTPTSGDYRVQMFHVSSPQRPKTTARSFLISRPRAAAAAATTSMISPRPKTTPASTRFSVDSSPRSTPSSMFAPSSMLGDVVSSSWSRMGTLKHHDMILSGLSPASGSVLKPDSRNRIAAQVEVGQLWKGSFYGFPQVLLGKHLDRLETVIAATMVEVLVLTRSDLVNLSHDAELAPHIQEMTQKLTYEEKNSTSQCAADLVADLNWKKFKSMLMDDLASQRKNKK